MTKKIFLAKGNVDGNLKSAKQHYFINFLPEAKILDKLYSPKVEIELLVPSVKGSSEAVVRSLRFDDPAQLYLFIIDLLIAFAYFKRSKFELSEANIHYLQSKLSSKFLSIEQDVMRGVYDG